MSEATFRIIIAVAVAAAGLALLAQACAVFALYGVTRTMKRDIGSFVARSGSVFSKAAPVFKELDQFVEKAELVIDTLSSTGVRLGYGFHRLTGLGNATTLCAHQVESWIQGVKQTAGGAHELVDEVHGAVADIGGDVLATVRAGKAHVEYARGILHGAGELVRRRLEQLDQERERTIRELESVSHAALAPVRITRGLAAGVSAGVETLVRPFARRAHGAEPANREDTAPHKRGRSAA